MKCPKSEKKDFELNSGLYGQPVKLIKYWCNVQVLNFTLEGAQQLSSHKGHLYENI